MNGVTLHVDSRAHAKTHVGTSPSAYTVRLSEPIRDATGVELVGSSVPTVTEVTLRAEHTATLGLKVHSSLHYIYATVHKDVAVSGTITGVTEWSKGNFFASVTVLVTGDVSRALEGDKDTGGTLHIDGVTTTHTSVQVVHVNPVEACVQIDGVGDGLPNALKYRDPSPFARELTYASGAACMEGGACYTADVATPFPADLVAFAQPSAGGVLHQLTVTAIPTGADVVRITLPGSATIADPYVDPATDTTTAMIAAVIADNVHYDWATNFAAWTVVASDSTVFFYNPGGVAVDAAHVFDANGTGMTVASGFVQRTLTVTRGATNTADVAVVLDGATAVNANVTSGYTTAQVAAAIAAETFPDWSTSVKGAVVTFTATDAAGMGAGANTATGAGVTGIFGHPEPAFWRRSVAADGRLMAPQTQDVANSADTLAVLPMDATAAANPVIFRSEPRTWKSLKMAIYRADNAEAYPFPYRNTGTTAAPRLEYQPHTLRLRVYTAAEGEHEWYRHTARVNVGPKATAYGLPKKHPEHDLRGGDYYPSQHPHQHPHHAARHEGSRHYHA